MGMQSSVQKGRPTGIRSGPRAKGQRAKGLRAKRQRAASPV